MNSLEALAAQIKETLGEVWLPRFYRERILPLRTRAHELPASTNRPEQVNVQHTLLGVELKIGRRRLSCPDLATARYLATFARANCANVAVPYDISRISQLADELESSWQRMLLLVDHLASERARLSHPPECAHPTRAARFAEAGAGTQIPQFQPEHKTTARASLNISPELVNYFLMMQEVLKRQSAYRSRGTASFPFNQRTFCRFEPFEKRSKRFACSS